MSGYSVVDFALPAAILSGVQFEHVAAPSIDHIIPATFSRSGGTELRVYGTNFDASSRCVFNAMSDSIQIVPAVVHTTSELRCVTPVHLGGMSTLSVAHEGEPNLSASSFDISFGASISVDYIHSTHVSAGTMVRVAVSGTVRNQVSDTVCRFGDIQVAGTINWLEIPSSSKHTINCIAPGGLEGHVGIEVSTNAADFTQAYSFVEFSQASNMTSVSPQTLQVARSAMTTITLNSNPQIMQAMNCLLANTATPATYADGKWSCAVAIAPSVSEGFRIINLAAQPNAASEAANLDLQAATTVVSTQQVELVDLAQVHALIPSRSSVSGGTVVTLLGTGFRDGIECVFSSVSTHATVKSSSEAVCTTPASLMGSTQVSVMLSDAVSDTMPFVFQADPQVYKMTPNSGIPGASVHVSLSTRFDFCRLNDVLFEARSGSGKQLCVVPATSAGQYELVVGSADEQNFIPAGIFTIVPAANITSISPSVLSLGTALEIQVFGSGFALSTQIGCTASPTVLWEAMEHGWATNTESVACQLNSAATAGFTAIDLTLDRTEYTHAGEQILLTEPAVVSSISPSQGPVVGGTLVTIRGSGLRKMWMCNFGGAVSSATILSSSHMVCEAPAAIMGTVSLGISAYGQGDVFHETEFRYIQAVSLDVQPQAAHAHGGAVLVVSMSPTVGGLSSGMCSLGVTVFSATVLQDSSGVRCALPALAQGNHSMAVSFNGQDWTYAQHTVETQPSWNNTASDLEYSTLGSKVEAFISGSGLAVGAPYCAIGGQYDGITAMGVSNTLAGCAVNFHNAGFQPLEVTPLKNQLLGASALQVEFLELASVSEVFPSTAESQGGTIITVTGTGFVKGRTECHFGWSSAAADVLSSTEMRCVAAATAPSVTKMAVSMGIGSKSESVPFAYHRPPVIQSVEPAFSRIHGGTLVTVSAVGLVVASEPRCCFDGSILVKPVAHDVGQLKCRVPAVQSGNHSLSIQLRGHLAQSEHSIPIYMSTSVNITQVTHPTTSVHHLASTSNWVLAGGASEIMLNGFNLRLLGDYLSAPIHCHADRSMWLASSLSSTSVQCQMSGLKAGFRAMELGLGSQQITYSDASVEAVAMGTIDSVQPSVGLGAGGTVITVSGANLVSERTYCRFNGQVVQAQVKSTEEANCLMPPGLAGSSLLEISTTGGSEYDVSSKQILVTYASRMKVTGFSPTIGWHNGGTRMSVSVSNSREGKPVMLRFGTVHVVTQPLQNGVANVDSVALQLGNTTLGASMNSDPLSFTDEIILFNVVQSPNVSSITPSVVLSGHETSLTVDGTLPQSFSAMQTYYCHLSTSVRESPQYSISAARIISTNTASLWYLHVEQVSILLKLPLTKHNAAVAGFSSSTVD
jgi:hypothetical protein